MELLLLASLIAIGFVWWRLEHETLKRKKFETIVARLRDKKQSLGEELTCLYMEAEQYNEFGEKLKKA